MLERITEENRHLVSRKMELSLLQRVVNDHAKGLDAMPIGEVFTGGFMFEDVPLMDGRVMNVWVEFAVKKMDDGELFGGVQQMYITDEDMPDEFLDRYNEMRRKDGVISSTGIDTFEGKSE
jgi:hypothetical protein